MPLFFFADIWLIQFLFYLEVQEDSVVYFS